jgi:transposase InsO family protein
MDTSTKNQVLSEVYHDIDNSGSYGSVRTLFNAARQTNPAISQEDVRRFLRSQFAYTLHRQARKKWVRNPIVVEHVNELFQCDLVEVSVFARDNDGHRFILTVIDALSKFAFAIPIKNKTGPVVKEALETIFKDRIPASIQSDQGPEFTNKVVQDLLKELGIQFYIARNPQIKCAIVERFNRTLRNKVHKYLTAKGTKRFIDALPRIIRTYNNSVHSSIKMKPIDVNEQNAADAFQNLHGYTSKRLLLKAKRKKQRLKLQVGDTVRRQRKTTRKTNLFDKSYWPGWEDTVETVENINKSLPRLQVRVDGDKRRYYDHEVQKVASEPLSRIEKIIKSRTVEGNKEFFVKFVGYPADHNDWIAEEDMVYL